VEVVGSFRSSLSTHKKDFRTIGIGAWKGLGAILDVFESIKISCFYGDPNTGPYSFEKSGINM
jgi:hypothetical protein